jgi:hypothetical protein
MSDITLRGTKGSPLTNQEVDDNFDNLNTEKLQSGDTAASLTISSADINGGTIDGTVIGATTTAAGSFTNLQFDGLNPTVTYDFNGSGTVTSADSLAYIKLGSGISTGVDISATPVVAPSWSAATGTVYADNKFRILAAKGNSTDALTVATAGSASGYGDTVVIGNVDVNGSDTKLITGLGINGELITLAGNATATGTLAVTGEIAANGGIALGDNDKATFGDGDLQIYHDGGNSIITNSTGNLIIRDSVGGNILIQGLQNQPSVDAIANGAVNLYYSGNAKLSTTATGIDVTGDVNTSGLLKVGANDTEYANNYIRFKPTGTSYIDHSVVGQNINFRLSNVSSLDKTPLVVSPLGIDVTGTVTADGLTVVGITSSSNGTYGTKLTYSNGNQSGIIDTFGNHNLEFRTNDDRAMNIASNGDISFYEDTGTTPKFVWSSSAEKLTLSGTGGLTVSKTDGSIVKLESTGTGLGAGAVIGDLQFYGNDASTPGAGIKASITATTVAALGDDSQLMFSTSDGTTNNVNRMLIANNGDVSFYEDTGTTAKLTWSGAGEDLNFADNVKATFGAGDLQIYHDGSNSIIYEGGTGDLQLRGNGGSTTIMNGGGTETLANFGNNGSVDLYYDNALKLSTKATGIDISGTATMDGLTVTGTLGNFAVNTEGTLVTLSRPSTSYIRATDVAGSLAFDTGGSNRRIFVANNGDISFYEDTGTTPKFFWDASAESLGIGTSSPASLMHLSSSAPVLSFTDTNSFTDVNDRFIVRAASDRGAIQWYDDSLSTTSELMTFFDSAVVVNENGVDADFRVESDGNTHALFVEGSSGNVAIGTTTVNSKFNVASSQDTLKYNEGVTVFRSTSSNKMFLNCVAGGANIVGSNSPITFNYHDQTTNNVTEAVRIVSGNLLVGKTASDLGVTAGIELNGQYDVGYFTRSGDKPLVVNRLSSDGTILDIRKDGTSVGSIGVVNANNLTIGGAVASHAGMEFGTNQIAPRSGGTSVDATVDLGYFSLRWKDLYLSGGVYLGGTGAANKLEDYEEGTWNGVITDGTNNATMADTECFYTKTGRLVTLSGDISTSALGSVAGSSIRISGVPFTNGAKGVSAAIGRAGGLAITAGYIPTLYFDASSSALRLGLFDNAGGTTTLQATEWTDDGQISFSITYMTS